VIGFLVVPRGLYVAIPGLSQANCMIEAHLMQTNWEALVRRTTVTMESAQTDRRGAEKWPSNGPVKKTGTYDYLVSP
jgi:hypothetical protein